MRVLVHMLVQLMYKPWKFGKDLGGLIFFVCTNHENAWEGFFYANFGSEKFLFDVQTMKIFECDLEGKRSKYFMWYQWY